MDAEDIEKRGGHLLHDEIFWLGAGSCIVKSGPSQ